METIRSDGGASLPPRKRLLAGLKQNGWYCPASKATGEENRACRDSDCCVICRVKEEDSVKVKNGTRFVSVCNSCKVLLNSGAICCYCYGRVSDDKDLSVVFTCCKCQHRVHADCNNKHNSGNVGVDPKCFVCVDCTPFKLPVDAAVNGLKVDVPGLGLGFGFEVRDKEMLGLGLGFEVRDKERLGLGFEVCHKERLGLAVSCNSDARGCNSEVGFAVSAAGSVVFSVDKTLASSVHKSLGKKPLVESCKPAEACSTTDSRTVDGSGEGGSANFNIRKSELLLKSPVELEALVAEAKGAAVRAAATVAVAKEAAFRKASEAARAAAVAKESLNIAALAAREEREIKEILRKKHSSYQGTSKLADRKRKIEEAEAKGGLAEVSTMSVVDDEELARRLHRAINSSPRISRNTVALEGRDPGKLREPGTTRAHSQRSGLPNHHTRLRITSLKKQEEKLHNKSESVNWGKLADKAEPGSQSACGKFGGSPIDKLLQTLDHSETESSVGLLALNQDCSVHDPIAEDEMRDSSNGPMVQVLFTDYDEKASDAGRVLKELAVCEYSRTFVKDENGQPLEPEAGNLEKLAETVAVVIEEENSRCEEDKLDGCIKEEAASCSTKPSEPVGAHQSPEPGESTSQKQAGVKRKKVSLDPLKIDEFRIRSSKSSRTPVQAGNYNGSVALDTKDSPISDGSTVRFHARRSNARSNSERRTKSISGDFPQESQGSARAVSTWHQDILKPSQSFADSVNLAPQVPLQSPTFASGPSRKHS